MISFRKFAIKAVRFVVAQRKKVINIAELPPSEFLKGRTALITGGTGGIGFEIAKAYLKAGATVVITGRNLNKIKNTIKMLDVDNQNAVCGGVNCSL